MEQKPLDQPKGETRPGSAPDSSGKRGVSDAPYGAAESAPLVAPSRFETPTPRPRDEPIVETPSAKAAITADRVSGTRVVLATMVLAAVASAVIEYQGWQIGFRTSGQPTGLSGIPVGGFLRGVVDNFSGALGLGAVAAIAATLLPASWKRPWRAIAAGFAFGAAGFILALAWVTSLAP